MNSSPFSSATASYEAPEPAAPEGAAPRRRMGRAEFARRLQSAPPFRYRPPTDRELDALVGAYEAIVGRRTSMAVVNLLAACFRVHGPATAERLRALHAELRTATNLLGELRLREPSTFKGAGTEEPRPREGTW